MSQRLATLRHTLGLAWQVILLGRLLFLFGGILFHALGVMLAWSIGAEVNLAALFWGQIAITAVQLMTHYSNDYFDLTADRLNLVRSRWAGSSQVLPAGLVPPRWALWLARGLALVAVGAGITLRTVADTGPLTLPLILLALALAWVYSAPPWRLHWRGLGELTVAVIVPGLTTLLGFYLQAGWLAWLPLLTAVPLMGLQFTMSLTIDFPDAAGDAAAGKRTLVVRLGGGGAVRLWLLVQGCVYLSLPLLWLAGLPESVALALLLPLPASLVQGWRLWRGAWRQSASWDSLSFWAIGLLVGSAGLALLGALWSIG